MLPRAEASTAQAQVRSAGDVLVVEVSGDWRLTAPRPAWGTIAPSGSFKAVRFDASQLGAWDSSLVLFVMQACASHPGDCDFTGLPPPVRQLAARMRKTQGPTAVKRRPDVFTGVGLATNQVVHRLLQVSRFVGECVLSVGRLLRQPQKFRWRDCLQEMQQCGALALPVAGLIAFLIGVTLAYTGSVILRQFGADIYVADLVGVGMTREMGAVMTGIVLAGRTGAAFAAEIGNMKAGEEIDALETLGIRAIDFLVMPRIVALVLMMPLLALYANALGIIGGMVVALLLLDITPTAYWVEMLTIVDMSDLMTGLIKAFTFGAIVALSGCLRGLQADRSAVGVGRAATSAVVTSILLIVVADALFAVIFNILGW